MEWYVLFSLTFPLSIYLSICFSDYGYTPVWSDNILSCKAIEGFDLSSVCPPNEKYYYHSSSGYVTNTYMYTYIHTYQRF